MLQRYIEHICTLENEVVQVEKSKARDLFRELLKRKHRVGLEMMVEHRVPINFASAGREIEDILKMGDLQAVELLLDLKMCPDEVVGDKSKGSCLGHAVRLKKDDQGNCEFQNQKSLQ